MKKFAFALSALLLSAATVVAQEDPIAVRKALMHSNQSSTDVSVAMLREQSDYDPAIAKAAIDAIHATAMALGDFFPEGSQTGDTRASPRIWEDPEGFNQAVEDYQADTTAAVEASGDEGPADLAAFQAAIGPVLENCGSCHENWRVSRN